MVVVIDYGMGNIRSIVKGLSFSSKKIVLSNRREDILKSRAIVLPGVGTFDEGMKNLNGLGIIPYVKQAVMEGKFFLGICLGMQLIFLESEEGVRCKGIGLVAGKVKRFAGDVKVPHMGWNTVKLRGDNKILKDIPDESYFYFVHSYYVIPEDKRIVSGITSYGTDFASAVNTGNIYAAQFHPEKSQAQGLKILESFCGL